MSFRKASQRLLSAFTSVMVVLCLLLTGCDASAESSTGVSAASADTYVFVTKSAGNAYNDCMAQGFFEVIEAAGGRCIIINPSEATAEAQLSALNDILQQNDIVSLTIAADDADALQATLQAAMQRGIKVTSVDSAVNAVSRQIFINQAATEEVARALVEEVYNLCDGSGQWAILSATSQATNQNAWIGAMQELLAQDEKYAQLRLVDIAYGNDDEEDSKVATRLMLDAYPDLKAICVPTSVGLPAAVQTVQEYDSTVKVTGLSLPSKMAQYVSAQQDTVCSCFYLWDPRALGRLAAYASMALVDGTVTGAAGETFVADDMGEYTVLTADDGGTEVILDLPLRIDSSNIDSLKDSF